MINSRRGLMAQVEGTSGRWKQQTIPEAAESMNKALGAWHGPVKRQGRCSL